MSDYYEEIEEESLGKRIFKAIILFIFAPCFIAAGYFIIQYAEKKRADSNAVLKDMQTQTVKVNQFNSTNNNKIVLVQDSVFTKNTIKDKEFGVESNGIRLYRQVATYQWKETKKTKSRKKNRGGSTTNTNSYEYNKVWVIDGTIDSKEFRYPEGHENTVFVNVKPKIQENSSVQISDFTLQPELVKHFEYFEPLSNLSPISYKGHETMVDTGQMIQCVSLQNVFKKLIDEQDFIDFEKDSSLTNTVNGQLFFMGQGSVQHPVIGDVKVMFWESPNKQVYSIVAEQNSKLLQLKNVEGGDIFSQTACDWMVYGNGTSTATHEKGEHTNEFGMIGYGIQEMSDLFSEAKNANSFLYSFIFRLAALICFIAGFFGYKYIVIVIHDAVSENPNNNFEHKVMHSVLLLAYATTMSVVGTEWAKYNTVADLTIWDNYFSALVLLMINSGYRLTISVGGEEMGSGESIGGEE